MTQLQPKENKAFTTAMAYNLEQIINRADVRHIGMLEHDKNAGSFTFKSIISLPGRVYTPEGILLNLGFETLEDAGFKIAGNAQDNDWLNSDKPLFKYEKKTVDHVSQGPTMVEAVSLNKSAVQKLYEYGLNFDERILTAMGIEAKRGTWAGRATS